MAHAIALQSDGRILAGGLATAASSTGPGSGTDEGRFAATRLLGNGALDPSFGINGTSTGHLSAAGGGYHTATDIAIGNGGLTVRQCRKRFAFRHRHAAP